MVPGSSKYKHYQAKYDIIVLESLSELFLKVWIISTFVIMIAGGTVVRGMPPCLKGPGSCTHSMAYMFWGQLETSRKIRSPSISFNKLFISFDINLIVLFA